jgi:triacylglycerol lipase
MKNYYYITNNDTDVNLYIFKKNNVIYIVFRGTSSSKDVLIDLKLNFKKILNPYVNVHTGFYDQFFSIYDKIYENITDEITVINILGHSLGGGVATIASALIANYFINNNNKKEVNCYVFGCPRVGDSKFKKLFNDSVDNHYNYCFYNDIIGMVPINYKYQHACNFYKIRKNGVIVLCKDDMWYKRFFTILFNVKCYKPFSNHSLDSYLEHFISKNI